MFEFNMFQEHMEGRPVSDSDEFVTILSTFHWKSNTLFNIFMAALCAPLFAKGSLFNNFRYDTI
jgi:hypothetical protein